MNLKYYKNIHLMYAISFFDGLILAYVIERLFWAERGMNVTMVVATEIIYAVTILILEVPSGVCADKFGRKNLLLLAGLMSLIEICLIYFAHSFLMFALAVFFAGIKRACSSGAMQAMVYDSLLVEKKECTYEGIYGRIQVFDTIGASIAALSGGVFAYYLGFEFNYIVSIGSKLIAFILVFFLKEPPRHVLMSYDNERENIKTYMTLGKDFFKSHRVIFQYCMIGCFLSASFTYMDEFWQLLIIEINVPIYLFGIVSIGYSIFTIPGNLFADRIKKVVSYDKFFKLSPFVYAIGFILIAILKSYVMFIPMAILGMWKGVLEPLLGGCIQHNTKSDIRATVESLISFIERFISIGVGFIFSVFANKNIFVGYLSLGIICLIYGLKNVIRININKR